MGGFSPSPSPIVLPAAQVGEIVEVQVEVKAPEENGRFIDFWRAAVGEKGELFGDRLWVDITVESDGDALVGSGSASSGSLASSFVAPPVLNAQGRAASFPPSTSHSHSRSNANSHSAPSTTFSIPSHLSSAAPSEFESVSAGGEGLISRAGSEGVYLSDDEEEVSSEESSSEEESSSSEESSSEEEEEEGSEDGFVVVDGEEDDF
jgi:hypothetical protein